MATPTMMEVMGALITIERFLKAEAEKLKERFPAQADAIQRIIDSISVQERTLEALAAAWSELQVLATGRGPVVHKPEDMS